MSERLPTLIFVVLALGVVVVLAGICVAPALVEPLGRPLTLTPGQPDQPEQILEPTRDTTAGQPDQPEQIPEPTRDTTPGQPDQPEPSPEPTRDMSTGQPGQPMMLLVLGIGQWAGENEAETIFVVDIDSSGQVVSVTGFAPSLEVDVAGLEAMGITRSRLKMVYHHGLELPGADEVSAASLLAQALVDNFGITPDQYIVVQEDYLASMIDTLGGIDVSLPAAFGDVPPGDQHFDGEKTWRYVGYIPQPGIPEEVRRIERHKYVLEALRDKLLSASTLPKIPDLLAGFVVERGIKTDLSAQQILYLVGVLGNTSLEEISFTVIPES